MRIRTLAFSLIALCAGTASADVTLEVSDDLESVLDGYALTYAYEHTRAFEVKFEDGTITYRFRMPDGEYSDFRSPVPYFGRTLGPGRYYIGWHEEDVTNYVTLLINLGAMEIYSSAILGDYDVIHFQRAEISQITRN